ncbi:hypothetical protein B0T20DRAFT_244966 [Sordaria brevicollis]|uniref:FAD/NAD(P)-binding domain-containing protein n=1 Tax=Sordaria brevicollis TaxID=83679 RepID=A0AAE0PBM3_SORBR|nr:hypothetical protein B0T20DRAFT_244966 [Sordaria brevicollis]
MIDILIIGAGPSGLCAAKTFLQHDPNTNIVIIDGHSTVGGVWSKERLYPTLRTNNMYPTMDFSDFPMEDVGIGRPGHHITGEEMHTYLTAYAQHFDLMKRIRLNTRALRVQQTPSKDGWEVDVQSGDDPNKTTILDTKKLVMATGILGVPNMPSFKGEEAFDAPLFHSSSLGPRYTDVLQNPSINRIAVLGGSKSAYDTVYLAATTGHKVDWIIRKSGRGPSWVFPSHTKIGPFKAWREKLITRRIATFMSPCILPDHSGSKVRDFLHTNRLGKVVARKFWKTIHADTIRDCRYREGKDPRYTVLEPDHNPFWYGTSSGTLNYEQDFKSLITSGQVTVHREDISHLGPHTIHFADDGAGSLEVDALICATGYSAKPPVEFFPKELHFALGIPTDSLTEEQKDAWKVHDERADKIIADRFPQLLSPPFSRLPSIPSSSHTSPPRSPSTATFPSHPFTSSSSRPPHPSHDSQKYTPWRLHRGLAPPGLITRGDHSLIFLSMFSSTTNIPRIEIQSLWALAYFLDLIPLPLRTIPHRLDCPSCVPTLPSPSSGQETPKLQTFQNICPQNQNLAQDPACLQIMRETALFQRWCKWRSPLGHGRHYPDLNFDQLAYWDWLVADLGLETRRKKVKGGRSWRELTSSYEVEDYRGLVGEWVAKNGMEQGQRKDGEKGMEGVEVVVKPERGTRV